MTDLTAQERLQPSLLDRLTDTIFYEKSVRLFAFDFGNADDGRPQKEKGARDDLADDLEVRHGERAPRLMRSGAS